MRQREGGETPTSSSKASSREDLTADVGVGRPSTDDARRAPSSRRAPGRRRPRRGRSRTSSPPARSSRTDGCALDAWGHPDQNPLPGVDEVNAARRSISSKESTTMRPTRPRGRRRVPLLTCCCRAARAPGRHPGRRPRRQARPRSRRREHPLLDGKCGHLLGTGRPCRVRAPGTEGRHRFATRARRCSSS